VTTRAELDEPSKHHCSMHSFMTTNRRFCIICLRVHQRIATVEPAHSVVHFSTLYHPFKQRRVQIKPRRAIWRAINKSLTNRLAEAQIKYLLLRNFPYASLSKRLAFCAAKRPQIRLEAKTPDYPQMAWCIGCGKQSFWCRISSQLRCR
jgi:hypothetical protein